MHPPTVGAVVGEGMQHREVWSVTGMLCCGGFDVVVVVGGDDAACSARCTVQGMPGSSAFVRDVVCFVIKQLQTNMHDACRLRHVVASVSILYFTGSDSTCSKAGRGLGWPQLIN